MRYQAKRSVINISALFKKKKKTARSHKYGISCCPSNLCQTIYTDVNQTASKMSILQCCVIGLTNVFEFRFFQLMCTVWSPGKVSINLLGSERLKKSTQETDKYKKGYSHMQHTQDSFGIQKILPGKWSVRLWHLSPCHLIPVAASCKHS